MKLKKSNESGAEKKYTVGGIIQAGLGTAQAIYGIASARKANKEMKSLLANAPQLTLPSAYEKYADQALSDTMLRRQTEEINRNLASSTQALGQAGGRALIGGLQSATSGANESLLDAQAKQREVAMQGLGVLGQAQERLRTAKEDRLKTQYGSLGDAKNAALANIGGGLKSIAEGVSVGGAFDFLKKDDENGSKKDGGKLSGKFSHKENPIHMINNDGKKVGEATGGEYILNPKQAAAISKESAYFRSLMKKKQFKK